MTRKTYFCTIFTLTHFSSLRSMLFSLLGKLYFCPIEREFLFYYIISIICFDIFPWLLSVCGNLIQSNAMSLCYPTLFSQSVVHRPWLLSRNVFQKSQLILIVLLSLSKAFGLFAFFFWGNPLYLQMKGSINQTLSFFFLIYPSNLCTLVRNF